MALFKVNRGNESNLPTKLTDGWAYFCTDTGSFLIDHYDSTNTLIRSKINAEYAEKLRYVQNGEIIELDSATVAAQIANKVDKVSGKGLSTNDFNDTYKAKLDNLVVPTKTSELTNDSDFATNASVTSVKNTLQASIDGKSPSDHTHGMQYLTGHCIELNRDGSISGYGGLLDFHFNGSTADYTSRIIENASGTLSINGVKCTNNNVSCSALDITNGATKNKTSGYVKLNNGMILQWGSVSNVANGTSTWVSFPITFPNSVGGNAMLTGNYGNSFGYELHANNISASGFTIVKKGGSSASGTDTVSWLVVGW